MNAQLLNARVRDGRTLKLWTLQYNPTEQEPQCSGDTFTATVLNAPGARGLEGTEQTFLVEVAATPHANKLPRITRVH